MTLHEKLRTAIRNGRAKPFEDVNMAFFPNILDLLARPAEKAERPI